jgi:hypothetical protein
MRNINSSTKLETLLELTIKTIDISFDVDKALIAIYDKENEVFNITNTLNIETKKKVIKTNTNWKKVFEGDAVFEVKGESVLNYIDKILLKDVGVTPGILIVPICIDRVDIEMLGVMIIFKYGKVAINDEENLLTMETIAGHIAPVLNNLSTIDEQSRFCLPNYIQLFKRDLKKEINEALEFSLDLQVIRVLDKRDFVFRGNAVIGKLKQSFPKIYPFTNHYVFIITNEINDKIESKIKRIVGLNDVNIDIKTLGKDFVDFQDFFKLFE